MAESFSRDTGHASPVIVGIGLKMYFGVAQTGDWARSVAELAGRHPAILSRKAELFVLPSFTALATTLDIFAGTAVRVGAQDLHWQDRGAFTGEVSGSDLAELGCTLVEVGHSERRSLFAEDESTVRLKVEASLRNSLTPILCIGEPLEGTADVAARVCVRQLESALTGIPEPHIDAKIIVAYEPEWAIGAKHSASTGHVTAVVVALRECLRSRLPGMRPTVIYGGSAGPGLLSGLGGGVDGLFLGRSAHDPAAIERVLDEVLQITGASIG